MRIILCISLLLMSISCTPTTRYTDLEVTPNLSNNEQYDDNYIRYNIALWCYTTKQMLNDYERYFANSTNDENMNQSLYYKSVFKQNCPILREEDFKSLEKLAHVTRAFSIENWGVREAKDTVVSSTDQYSVVQIIRELYTTLEDLKCNDLDSCLSIKYSFFNKRRCHVAIMIYDNGPLAAAGLDVYLIKINGSWKIIDDVRWIS